MTKMATITIMAMFIRMTKYDDDDQNDDGDEKDDDDMGGCASAWEANLIIRKVWPNWRGTH